MGTCVRAYVQDNTCAGVRVRAYAQKCAGESPEVNACLYVEKSIWKAGLGQCHGQSNEQQRQQQKLDPAFGRAKKKVRQNRTQTGNC